MRFDRQSARGYYSERGSPPEVVSRSFPLTHALSGGLSSNATQMTTAPSFDDYFTNLLLAVPGGDPVGITVLVVGGELDYLRIF